MNHVYAPITKSSLLVTKRESKKSFLVYDMAFQMTTGLDLTIKDSKYTMKILGVCC